MSREGGQATPIPASMIARAQNGVRAILGGIADWFGPGAPQPAQAPPQVEGRQWQMPVGVNMVNTTKTEGLSHQTLRLFADSCDIVRLLIETRKDQICGRAWNLKVIEDTDVAKPARGNAMEVGKKADPRLKELTAFFKSPDRSHTWSEWLRMLLEDLLVIDAPTLYYHKTNGGEMYALRPIDGATIKRIVDTHGWVPDPPLPAYQQILNGVIATSYTTEELMYKPRNIRTNKIYGYSHVEQVIVTAKQWLSRQASNLEYYESGNVPEGFLQGAKDWTPEQLEKFQLILDQMLSGNYAARKKVRVVPHDSAYQAVKEPALKSDFDEWLARIACFCFGYPPTPFIKQMNRSTSDNDKESSGEEGEAPIMQWVKEAIDFIIQVKLGQLDIEFVWEDKEAQDPLERATIDTMLITARVLDPNEVRAEMGLKPLPPPEPTVVGPDGKPLPPGSGGGGKPPQSRGGNDKDKAAKLHKAVGEGADIDSPEAVKQREQLAKEIAAALELTGEEVVKQIVAFLEEGERNAAILAQKVSLSALDEVEVELSKALAQVAQDAGATAIEALDVEVSTSLVNHRAVDWAKDRAAELIGKNAAGDGDLLETTRNDIRALIEKAMNEGWSSKQVSKALQESFAFSKQRAEMIARTEIAMASMQGSMLAWAASGVVKKKLWLLSNSEGVCTVCQGNKEDGAIPIVSKFSSGDMMPPSHPNCRCSLAPITED